MASFDSFERAVRQLIQQQECSPDSAIRQALKDYAEIADQADAIQRLKQRLEREKRGL